MFPALGAQVALLGLLHVAAKHLTKMPVDASYPTTTHRPPTFLALAAAPAFLPGAPPVRLAVARGAAALPPAALALRVAAACRLARSFRSAVSHSLR